MRSDGDDNHDKPSSAAGVDIASAVGVDIAIWAKSLQKSPSTDLMIGDASGPPRKNLHHRDVPYLLGTLSLA